MTAISSSFCRPLERLLAYDRMHEVYGDLLRLLLWDVRAKEEVNERTGVWVKVLPGGVSFRLDLGEGLPTVGLRRTYPRVAAAETAWYLMGTRDVRWMQRYARIWDKFVEADGVTVNSAYGYRWRKHFGRDQIALATSALLKNPTDRRCYVTAWDPSVDGLGASGQRNVPCPIGFNLMVQDGKLHSTLFWRSCDVFVGLPYDVMGHALLMDAVAVDLGIQPGSMQCSIGHAHLYDSHWGMAREALGETPVVPSIPLPRWSTAAIDTAPASYVEAVIASGKAAKWPDYAPRPEVVL